MKRVYVAHPFGGREENRLSVEKIIKELVRKDQSILYISPIHATGFLYDDVEYLVGMDYCLNILSVCDELLICPGWEISRGCKMEKLYAQEHNIPIRYLGAV